MSVYSLTKRTVVTRLAAPLMALTVTVAIPSATIAKNIKYYVEPYTLLSDSGEASSTIDGFITTDGTLGPLTRSGILDWRFEVSGPRPFVFASDDSVGAASQIELQGVVHATPTRIELPVDEVLDEIGNSLFVSSPVASLNFENVYLFRRSLVNYTFRGDGCCEGYSIVATPQIVLAIAKVPEPSSLVSGLLGMAGLLVWSRRN